LSELSAFIAAITLGSECASGQSAQDYRVLVVYGALEAVPPNHNPRASVGAFAWTAKTFDLFVCQKSDSAFALHRLLLGVDDALALGTLLLVGQSAASHEHRVLAVSVGIGEANPNSTILESDLLAHQRVCHSSPPSKVLYLRASTRRNTWRRTLRRWTTNRLQANQKHLRRIEVADLGSTLLAPFRFDVHGAC